MTDEDYDRARRLLAQLGDQDVDLAGGNLIRGRIYAAEGEVEQALAAYDAGLKQRPVFDEGWRQYGDLLLQAGDPEAAGDAYRRAVTQRPDNIAARIGVARSEQSLGRQGAALDALREAMQFAPDNAALVRQYLTQEERHGSRRVAMEARRRLAKSQPDNAENRLALVRLEALDGEVEPALQRLDQMEADHGRSRATVATRAAILQQADRPEEGRIALEQYLRERGDDAEAEDYSMLARYHLARGNFSEAEAAYQQARQREEAQQRPATRELADVYFTTGRFDQALPLYQELAAETEGRCGRRSANGWSRRCCGWTAPMKPSGSWSRSPLSAIADALRSIIAQQRGDTEQALTLINAALEKRSDNAMAFVQRAMLLAPQEQQRSRALDDLDRALAIDSGSSVALALRSDVLLSMGRTEEAMQTLRRLLEVEPNHTGGRRRLVQLYLQQDEPARARALVDDALERSPGEPAWLGLAAAVAQRQQNPEAALGHLEQLVQQAPSPAAIAQLAGQYLALSRPSAAEGLLSSHPTLLNQSPALQGLRGRALVAEGSGDEARRVFRLALERSTDFDQARGVINSMVEALDLEEAASLARSANLEAGRESVELALVTEAAQRQRYELALGWIEQLRPSLPDAANPLRIRLDALEALSRHQSGDHEGGEGRLSAGAGRTARRRGSAQQPGVPARQGDGPARGGAAPGRAGRRAGARQRGDPRYAGSDLSAGRPAGRRAAGAGAERRSAGVAGEPAAPGAGLRVVEPRRPRPHPAAAGRR